MSSKDDERDEHDTVNQKPSKPQAASTVQEETPLACERSSHGGFPIVFSVVVGLVAIVSYIGAKAYPSELEFLLRIMKIVPPPDTPVVYQGESNHKTSSRPPSGPHQQNRTQHRAAGPSPKTSIAIPTANLLDGGTEPLDDLPYYRPRMLTDSVVPPSTPAHSPDKVGLFLYKNGFSSEPVTALVGRSRLCASHHSLMSVLSGRVSDVFGCGDGCRVFLPNGWEVSSCEELTDDDKVWLVPPGREFMWPTFERGHKVEVRHVPTTNNKPIIVETLSQKPKLFHLHNFFSSEEADNLMQNALSITEPANRLKRSTTGQGDAAHQDNHRTSQNAWDMTSPTAIRMKKRCFELLGIRPYQESWADGLQVLRYNLSQAYNSHLDYLEYKPGGRLDSANGGVNRYATVVVYLTDVEEGGETVFPNAPSPDHDAPSSREVVRELRSRQLKQLGIAEESWEERLVVQCRTRLAFKPKKAQAVLFYDQLPDGRQDEDSLHGGCPVIQGIKWAANLWVWSGPVHGTEDVPDTNTDPAGVQAEFQSSVPGYSLFWQDSCFGKLEPGVPVRLNTFVGHQFNIRRGTDEANMGPKVKTFTIGPINGQDQLFEFDGE